MSKAIRRIVVALGASLVLSLALPASAGQRIVYTGQTSQSERVRVVVQKRDSGRRFISELVVNFTTTCEDSHTESFQLGFASTRGPRPLRVGEDGEFEVRSRERPGRIGSVAYLVAGTVGFNSVDGTFEFSYPSLTDDGQSQLCTSGTLQWSAERRGSRPALPMNAATGEHVTLLEVDRRGNLIEVEEP